MEYEEIKTIWKKYDDKLDNLEKLNKKMITEILIRKPQKKLNWMRFQNLYGLIMVPIVLVIALHPVLKIENIDLKFIIGFILTLSVIVYLCYIHFKGFIALKNIDLQNDSVIESAKKVNDFKNVVNIRQKYTFITYPILFSGVLLVCWNGFHFDKSTILFMIGLFVFALTLGYKQFKIYLNRIEKLGKEILELNEYKE